MRNQHVDSSLHSVVMEYTSMMLESNVMMEVMLMGMDAHRVVRCRWIMYV